MANPLNIKVQFEGEDQGAEALLKRVLDLLKQVETANLAANASAKKFGDGAKETLQAQAQAATVARQYADAIRQRAEASREAANQAIRALQVEMETQRKIVAEAKKSAVDRVNAAKEIGKSGVAEAQEQVRLDRENLRQAQRVTERLRDQEGQRISDAQRGARELIRANQAKFNARVQEMNSTTSFHRNILTSLQNADRAQRVLERQQLDRARERVRLTRAAQLRNPDAPNVRLAAQLARESFQQQADQIRTERALRKERIDAQRASLNRGIQVNREEIANLKQTRAAQNDAARAQVQDIRTVAQERLAGARRTERAAREELAVSRTNVQQAVAAGRDLIAGARQVGSEQVRAAQESARGTIANARQQVTALNQIATGHNRAANQAVQAANRMGRAAQTARSAIQQLNQVNAAGASLAAGLAKQLVGLFVAFQLGKAVRDFIQAGIDFNQVIQTSTLGIATLITAQAELRDENGKLIKGTEALNRAMALSEDQLTKLRIAGIQTAATTAQLVDAYQQAVGAGLAQALNLDQIRILTVQVVQAAQSLGVPMNQLNQEIRSILEATIDRNSRVAKALRVTNEEIRSAARSGKLFETLFEKFEAFTIAGPKIQQTFQAMKSNLVEAIQVLSGAGTKSLFDRITKLGNDAIQRIFDFDTGRVTKEFEPVVRAIEAVMARLGDIIGGVMTGFIEGVRSLSVTWEENRDRVDEVLDVLAGVVRQVLNIVVEVLKVGGGILKVLLDTRALYIVLRLVEGVLKFISQHVQFIAAVLGAVALRQGIAALAGVPAILSLIAAHPVVATAIAIVALGGAFTALADSAQRASEEMNRQKEEASEAEAEAAGLAARHAEISRLLQNQNLTVQQKDVLQRQQKDVLNQLTRGESEYGKILKQTGKSQADLGAETDALTKKRLAEKTAVLLQAQANLEAARKLAAAPTPVAADASGTPKTPARNLNPQGTLKAAQQALAAARADLERLNNEVVFGTQAAKNLATSLTSLPVPDKDKAKEALQALKAETDAAVKAIKEGLELSVAEVQLAAEKEVITQQDAMKRILELQLQANEDIAIAKGQLLDQTLDPSDRARLLGELRSLQIEREQLVLKGATDEVKLEKQAAELKRSIVVDELRLQGRDMEAAAFETGERYMTALKQAIDAGDEVLRKRIQALIARSVQNAAFDALRTEADRLEQQVTNQLQRIAILQESGAISSGEAFRQQKAVYEATIPVLTTMRDRLQAIAVTPEQINTVQQLTLAILQMNAAIDAADFSWERFKDNVGEAAADELGNAFKEILKGTKDIGEAFREMLHNLTDMILGILTKLAAVKIIEGALGIEIPNFASGGAVQDSPQGLVRGPGTSTSDSILARVSRDEYVMRGSAVRQVGVATLDYINQNMRLPKFALGGAVAQAGMVHQASISPSAQSLTPSLIAGVASSLKQTADLKLPGLSIPSTDPEAMKQLVEFQGTLSLDLADDLVFRKLEDRQGQKRLMRIISRHGTELAPLFRED